MSGPGANGGEEGPITRAGRGERRAARLRESLDPAIMSGAILNPSNKVMSTTSIQISGLRRQTIASLKSQAKAQGLSVEGYVREIIEAEMSISEMARHKTIDEVFAPGQQQFRESGMSDEELDRLVDAARHDQQAKVTRRKKR